MCWPTKLSKQNTNAQAALQAAQVVQGGTPEDQQQNTILRVIVDNVGYPVTLDVLHQVRSLSATVPYFFLLCCTTLSEAHQNHCLSCKHCMNCTFDCTLLAFLEKCMIALQFVEYVLGLGTFFWHGCFFFVALWWSGFSSCLGLFMKANDEDSTWII